jgi:hypothetical protein
MKLLAATQTSEAIRDALEQIFRAPEYQWDRRRSVLDVVSGWLRSVTDLLQRLSVDHPIGYYVLLGLLTAVLLAIIGHFGYVLWQVIKPQPEPAQRTAHKGSVRRAPGWYLQQAHEAMLAGRYAEALGYRFRSLLLTLDRHRMLSFHPAKTPAEYVDEMKLDSDERNAFVTLVGTLYRHLFGAVSCTAVDVQQFDAAASGLERHAASL